MPRPADIHVRLSKRGYDTLKELEETSGFSGSRLIEEIILAVSDIMENFANFEARMEEDRMSSEESLSVATTFMTALDTILSRLGYQEVFDEIHELIEKEESGTKKRTGKAIEKKGTARER